MQKWIGVLAAIGAVGLAVGGARADETAPALMAGQCVACHNPALADNPIPTLVGLDAEAIIAMMLAFKTDAVPSTIMGRLAKGYTDAEIEALATEVAAWEQGEAK
jgi:sulfide dehydrogenase cytochrome subunit